MYRPLPLFLTIKSSGIEGLGLFATKDIPAQTNLGISHYFFETPGDKKLIRTPLGGFYNQSDDPNCYSLIFTDFAQLVTKRDIKMGEELTTSYQIHPFL
jgi:SET domain-containing protein